MAELKKTFLSGKMNKDVDERLLPANVYRDALNIRVTNSSEQGVVENIPSNRMVSNIFRVHSDNSDGSGGLLGTPKIVGQIASDTVDKVYYFVSNFVQPNAAGLGAYGDAIIEYDVDTEESKIVFNDIYRVVGQARFYSKDENFGEEGPRVRVDFPEFIFPGQEALVEYLGTETEKYFYGCIKPGMNFSYNVISGSLQEGFSFAQPPADINGIITNFTPPNDTSTNFSGNVGGTYWTLSQMQQITNPQVLTNLDGTFLVLEENGDIRVQLSTKLPYSLGVGDAENLVAVFESERILNFDYNYFVDDNGNHDPMRSRSLITGINIIDDVIFFTDGKNEPKKIHIERGKIGSGLNSITDDIFYTPPNIFSSVLQQQGIEGGLFSIEQAMSTVYGQDSFDKNLIPTRLVIKDSQASLQSYTPGYLDKGVFDLKHSTVIRPNPEEPMKMEFDTSGVVRNAATKGIVLLPFALPKAFAVGDQISVLCAENSFSAATFLGAGVNTDSEAGAGTSIASQNPFLFGGTPLFYNVTSLQAGNNFTGSAGNNGTFSDLTIYNSENAYELISFGYTSNADVEPTSFDQVQRYGSHTWMGRSQLNSDFADNFNDGNGINFQSVGNFNDASATEFQGYYEHINLYDNSYLNINLDDIEKTGLPLPDFNGLKEGDICLMEGMSARINVPTQADGAPLGIESSQKYPHLFSIESSPDAPEDPLDNTGTPLDLVSGLPIPNRVLVRVDKKQMGFMDFNPYNGEPLAYGSDAEPVTEFVLTILAHQGATDFRNNGHLCWWALRKQSKVNVDFENSFLYFSYRYRYIDGEYSGLAPFTQAAFKSNGDHAGLADRELYTYEEWQNGVITMPDGSPKTIEPYRVAESFRNEINNFKLLDFVPKHIPEDVVDVEIFVKDSESPNVYSVDSLNYKSDQFNLSGVGNNRGSYGVDSLSFKNALEQNQLLRPYDAVPKRALAQEVIANRLIYGNYSVDYDLVDENGNDIIVDFTTSIKPYQKSIVSENVADDLPTYQEYLTGKNNGKPRESIKSRRTYQVGIVYRDDYGRETPVLTCENSTVLADDQAALLNSRIEVKINSLPPHWATSYKIFVKDAYDKFFNLKCFGYRQNNTFGSIDEDEASSGMITDIRFRRKYLDLVVGGDTLVQKTQHGGEPGNTFAEVFSVIGLEDNVSLTYEVQGTNVINGAVAAGESYFKCEVTTDLNLFQNANVIEGGGGELQFDATSQYNSTTTLAAYFETLPPQRVDVDLYFEASQAYPIVLGAKTDEQHIKIGSLVTFQLRASSGENIVSPWSYEFGSIDSSDHPYLHPGSDQVEPGIPISSDTVTIEGIQIPSIINPIYRQKFLVTDVNTGGFNNSMYETVNIKVKEKYFGNDFQYPEFGNFDIPDGHYLEATFTQIDETREGVGTSVSMRVKKINDEGRFELYKQTCPTALFPDNVLAIKIPWFNCFSFGDGRETMHLGEGILAASLDKGVKASITVDGYEEKDVSSGLIYSGMKNRFTGLNSLNQFIAALGVTKELNPTHGSIQKLHSRETDLIALCEDKVLNILTQKDALFNTDGSTNLSAINQVLGTAIAYEGEYGISKNPESFASHTYRMYFTDKARGAVLRLSKDGLTPISNIGMSDYFKNAFKHTKGNIVGGYNKDKNEYEITYNQGRNDVDLKTVAFDEQIDGWVSFRSYLHFTQPSCINNNYYNFDDGRMFHFNHPDIDLSAGRNVFNLNVFESSITTIFNQDSAIIKSFKAMNLEGSDAASRMSFDTINDELSVATQGDDPLGVFNIQPGWYVEKLTTDMEEGNVPFFAKRENKEFGFIQGLKKDTILETLSTDAANGLGYPKLQGGGGVGGSDIYYEYDGVNLLYNYFRVRGYANECISVGDNVYLQFQIPQNFDALENNAFSFTEEEVGELAEFRLLGEIGSITSGIDADGRYYDISLTQNLGDDGNYDFALDDLFPPSNDINFITNSWSYLGLFFGYLVAVSPYVNVSDIIGYYCEAKLNNNDTKRVELYSVNLETKINSK